MPRKREWTERDLSILQELYEIREMTKRQITATYFEGNAKYASKRLSIMKKEGLIITQVYGTRSQGKTKVAAYARLTERGMNLLLQRGRVDNRNYRARDLGLSIQQRQYITDANELHVRIPEVHFMDSRAIKRKHILNRGVLTVGGFITEQGDYLIYILNADAKERTLVKIVTEIRTPKLVQGYLIYYKSLAVKSLFECISEKQGLVTGGVPVYLLPFDDLGICMTRDYILSNKLLKLQKLFEAYGSLTPVQGQSKYGFLYGLRQQVGKRGPYVIELLTGDMLILKRCLRNYNMEASQREGRRVLLFCFEEEVQRYKQDLLSAAHVDIVGIPKSAFESHFEGSDAVRNMDAQG
ncbi:hypothetical protein UY286_05050 [Paenibacillus polymyxa]|uniref:hypothetical protein n=1 Tax=Paenibacillus polymyxa TaxID=1406 RepID=UPI002AB42DBC|nr:hypothetical protein [Paenibacillus polymyxa]MDY7989838.1 hypothetical protein [Paenibacillus polymyxa]MDY8116803.1 hypothetical protein [Paenibacillus polymyxa]